MKVFLERAWNEVQRGENIPLYVTIAVAFVLTILNVVSKLLDRTQIEVAPVTLGILALIAIGILGIRHRIEDIVEVPFMLDFSDQQQRRLAEDINRAEDLLVAGTVLGETLNKHYSQFTEKLQRGDTIRFLLVDPNSDACEMSVKRVFRPLRFVDWKNNVLSTLSSLEKLKKDTQQKQGKLEIRVIDFPLMYGGFFIDLDKADAAIYAWHYGFKTHASTSPKAILRRSSGKWFDYIREEVKQIFDQGKPWPEDKDAGDGSETKS